MSVSCFLRANLLWWLPTVPVLVGALQFAKALEGNKGLQAFDITANDLSAAGEKAVLQAIQVSGRDVRSLSGAERMQQFENMCVIA